MKTVFKSSEIAHIWANLTPAEVSAGRSGRSPGNASFSGPVFSSMKKHALFFLVGFNLAVIACLALTGERGPALAVLAVTSGAAGLFSTLKK